ncbi:MAG: CpaE family protein, partial [Acidimicrobiia bacterium]
EIEAPSGSSVAVAGPRGAPGRTEVALALAWQWATNRPTLLIDLDLEAPAIAIRLGRPPRPDISDVADAVHANGRLPTDAVQQVGRLNLIVGSHRAEEPALRPMLVDDVVEAALGSYELVVLDLGPRPADDGLLKQSDHAVVVAEASPNGLVRAARLTAEWSGPPPALVLNRIPNVDRTDVIRAARRWTGLDPIALVPDRQRIREAARAARPPDRILSKALARLEPPR